MLHAQRQAAAAALDVARERVSQVINGCVCLLNGCLCLPNGCLCLLNGCLCLPNGC